MALDLLRTNAWKVNPRNKLWRLVYLFNLLIGPLHDPVTWYGINYTGTQVTQWDFQNKGKSRWTGTSSFVLKVPLRNLRPSVIYSVPCDWIVQRAYCFLFLFSLRIFSQLMPQDDISWLFIFCPKPVSKTAFLCFQTFCY